MSLILKIEDWPAADRDLWHALFKEGSPLDDRGALVHLRQTSRHTLASRYGQWLKWMLDKKPAALALDPLERPTTARLKEWLCDLYRLAPMSRLMLIDGVLRIATAAGPDRDWSDQKALKARLKRAAGNGDPRRKQGRILSSSVLFSLAARLADEARRRPAYGLCRATGLRDAAMIAFLSLMPLRCRSMASLRLGTSVFVGEERISLALSGEDTKAGIPWETDVPVQSEAFLRTYLAEARPQLATRGSNQDTCLWLDSFGCGLRPYYIGSRIAQQTLRMTGIRVPPHFFRDAAATTLARTSPQAARLIRPVLGHKGFGTAERHYIHAQTVEAGRDYAKLLARLKNGEDA